jgi:gentisate 1,2-dioxygenase
MQEIPAGSRSGKHRHMTEEQILIIAGHGHNVHDGRRWEWERGDLVSIPAMAEHQHFNAGPDRPALLLSSMPSVGVGLGLGGIEQLEDAPEYASMQAAPGER